jgi:hypothetical protein
MPSPFPGMDPYLEQPAFWSSFHSRLIVAVADALAPSLHPKYYVEVETRTYKDTLEDEILVGIPDAVVLSSKSVAPSEIRTEVTVPSTAVQPRPKQVTVPMPAEVNERYLEVRELGTDTVVTVIEVLSPKNKRKGEGRTAYETKRQTVLGSLSHLVEIDLLRGGKPMAMSGDDTAADYRILVSRRQLRPTAELYGFSLLQPIPSFPLPLLAGDAEPWVDLQTILNGVHDRAFYDARIDYRQPPPPPALGEAN